MDKFKLVRSFSMRKKDSKIKSSHHNIPEADKNKNVHSSVDAVDSDRVPESHYTKQINETQNLHSQPKPPLPPKLKQSSTSSFQKRGTLKLQGLETEKHSENKKFHPPPTSVGSTQSIASLDKNKEVSDTESATPVNTPSTPSTKQKIMKMFSLKQKEDKDTTSDDNYDNCEVLPRRKKMREPFQVKYVKVHGEADGAYKNDSKPRGMVFMQNIKHFESGEYEERKGSNQDFQNLIILFRQMGYKVQNNWCKSGKVTKQNFMNALNDFVNHNHSKYDSAVIIIMSHGVRDKAFVTSDGEEVELMDVYEKFSNFGCVTLKDKPKIFILQFCRPQALPCSPSYQNLNIDAIVEQRVAARLESMKSQIMREITSTILEKSNVPRKKSSTTSPPLVEITDCSGNQSSSESLQSDLSQFSFDQSFTERFYADSGKGNLRVASGAFDTSPEFSDVFSIFAASSGGTALRDRVKGSLLIQAVCSVFSEYCYQDDIEELVKKVSKFMQQELSKQNPTNFNKLSGVERINNGLDKKFYFNPYPVEEKSRRSTVFF